MTYLYSRFSQRQAGDRFAPLKDKIKGLTSRLQVIIQEEEKNLKEQEALRSKLEGMNDDLDKDDLFAILDSLTSPSSGAWNKVHDQLVKLQAKKAELENEFWKLTEERRKLADRLDKEYQVAEYGDRG